MARRIKRRFFDSKFYPQERRHANILACILFWSILSYVLISHFVVGATQIVGRSMVPTLHDGDRLIINRLVYRFRPPRRGELVAVRFPGTEDLSVKRIVVLPDERVQIRAGRVFVNGAEITEPYLAAGTRTGLGALSAGVYEVAPDCYFVLGDNRANSLDSRDVGAVPRRSIVGRVILPAF